MDKITVWSPDGKRPMQIPFPVLSEDRLAGYDAEEGMKYTPNRYRQHSEAPDV